MLGSATRMRDIKVIHSMFNPAIMTPITSEEMSNHKGRGVLQHDAEDASWKQTYSIGRSTSYYKSYVSRSEVGIANTIMSRHRVGGPYGFIRMCVMLGTRVSERDDTLVIDSLCAPELRH